MADTAKLAELKKYGRTPQKILRQVQTSEQMYAHLTEAEGFEGVPPRKHRDLTWMSDEEYLDARVKSTLRGLRSVVAEIDRSWLAADPDDTDTAAARERAVALIARIESEHPRRAAHRDAQALTPVVTPEPTNV